MLSLIHYISALRRLKESEKTIHMMGGRKNCNEMLLAQHEMIELEKEYYADEVYKLFLLCIVFFVVVVPTYVVYTRGA